MTKKFDTKSYLGKERVYRPVAGSQGISRLWVWDGKQYAPPGRGKSYLARRYETDGGKRVRKFQYFESLEAARQWQAFAPVAVAVSEAQETITGPQFEAIVAEWKKRTFPALAEGTRFQYERMLDKHFGSLFALPVNAITPKRVDLWLDELKTPGGTAVMAKRRLAFNHELTLLGTILRYYENYHDDPDFRFPIKKRHREAIRVAQPPLAGGKDLTEEEFLRFRKCLTSGPHGEIMPALATVQYYQALRISEAAGVHWEDVKLNALEPSESRLRVVRSVFWPRKRGLKSYVKAGFKNSKSNDGVKEQPLFPEAFRALIALFAAGGRGLIFGLNGEHLEYRWIQHAYDRAFKAAGLPYSGTHIMRHGGCRRVYNQNPDTAVAQQLLGNANLQATLIYAKRHKGALTEVANKEWEQADRICSQEQTALRIAQ